MTIEALKKEKEVIEANISKLEKEMSGSVIGINFLLARKKAEEVSIHEPVKNLETEIEKNDIEMSHIGLFQKKRKKELQAKREKMKMEIECLQREEEEKIKQHEQYYQMLLQPLLASHSVIEDKIKQEKSNLTEIMKQMENSNILSCLNIPHYFEPPVRRLRATLPFGTEPPFR